MAISPNCHLIVVTGGKGGVGKSVFTANLACTFLLELKIPILLIDADNKSCGDQNIITGLRPNKTLNDLAQFSGSINPQSLNQIITKHQSGLNFIAAVRSAQEKINVSSDLIIKQIESISKFYQFIIVDLGNELDTLQLGFIEQASSIIVLTAPEVLVVNQTLRLLNELMSHAIPGDMIQVILNKASNNGLSVNAISTNLKKNILELIPNDENTTNASLQRAMPFVLTSSQSPIANAFHNIVRKLSGGILQRNKALNKPTLSSFNKNNSNSQKQIKNNYSQDNINPKNLLKMQIHESLIQTMDLKKGITDTKGDPNKEEMLKSKTKQVISQLVDKEASGLSRDERAQIIKEVLDEALRLGPLEDLLNDDNVSEIMVNGFNKIYIERKGRITLSPITFTSNQHLRNIIERIVTPIGRRIDEQNPYVDARLKDGSRVNAIIEPLSIDGPALTIRKFAKDPITTQNYINWNSITKPMSDFLKICVENGLNLIISGGTGTGKTTLLNVLSSFIPSDERIITVEDSAELQLKQEHVVRLETRPSNMEGEGEISIRDLIRNSLRMRPDRIVVGECRDGAALDMLQAMNTGHDGSMTTVHSNSPKECISRLETLCLMAGMDLPAKAIREQIAGAINLIVQLNRLSDGSRKVTSITEVIGMQGGEVVTMQEIFNFKEEGFDKNRKIIGKFISTGNIPTFINKLEQKGIIIPRNIFTMNQHNNVPDLNNPTNANANIKNNKIPNPNSPNIPNNNLNPNRNSNNNSNSSSQKIFPNQLKKTSNGGNNR